MSINKNLKGIILAGGNGTRLSPLTKSISKQLHLIYNKPLIYYSLSILLLAKIREIIIVCRPDQLAEFENLLLPLKYLGVEFEFIIQEQANGIPEAYKLCANSIVGCKTLMILGDNIFWGPDLTRRLNHICCDVDGAGVFAYEVPNPSSFGVAEFDNSGNLVDLVEKPDNPPSKFAITGLYLMDENVVSRSISLTPSARGETEITELVLTYLREKRLTVDLLGRGYVWYDTGTFDGMLDASNFVASIERAQGYLIASPEEICWRNGWVKKETILDHISSEKSSYFMKLRETLADAA